MHPILARAERLAAYLAAWLVVAGLLATAMVRQDLTWSAAFLLLLPVFLFYAFVCLSAWYVCRATPLTTSSAVRLLASSATAAAVVASGLLVFAARAWMSVLGAVTSLGPTMEQYQRNEALLFASGILLFLLALTVQYLLLAFEFAREAEERRLQLEVLSRDAELRALRAQVNPALPLQQPELHQRPHHRRSGRRTADVRAARRLPARHARHQRAAIRFRSPTSSR